MWWSVWPEMCAECTCWNYNIFTCPEMDGWAECISAVSGQWPVSSWCLYQGSCLCGTVNNRGKVIYCYGDLVPRHSELFSEGGGGAQGRTSPRDLLAAQLGIWVFGLLALWVLSLVVELQTKVREHFTFTEKVLSDWKCLLDMPL